MCSASRSRSSAVLEEAGPARLAEDQRLARHAYHSCASSRDGVLPRYAGQRSHCPAPSSAASPPWLHRKWWKEERHGVFIDYNQNAKDRTTCVGLFGAAGAGCARLRAAVMGRGTDLRPGGFHRPDHAARFAKIGDPHAAMDRAAGSLERLLELAAKDEAGGLGDAPWPPHFRKMESEGKRVAPSRAKKAGEARAQRCRSSRWRIRRSKEAALAGLERWKQQHAEAAQQLAVDDVLVDSMRGRSSTWTRIRVNLRHVPEESRPAPEKPDPDDAPDASAGRTSPRRAKKAA